MTWLAWRSQRSLLLVTVGAVVVLSLWLWLTGAADHAAWLAQEHACAHGYDAGCMSSFTRLTDDDRWTGINYVVLLLVPGVIGLVLGAPLVAREIEHGTNRLVWSQSIGRMRWVSFKLLISGVVAAVLVGGLAPLVAWWTGAVRSPADIDPRSFAITGFVSVGYVLFALLLGAWLGSLIGRTGWAIAAGVPIFVAVRAWVLLSVRPHLAATATLTGNRAVALGNGFEGGANGMNGIFSFFSYGDSGSSVGWYLNSGYVPDGRVSPRSGQRWNTGYEMIARCMAPLNGRPAPSMARCLSQLKLHFVAQYQPANHYWALQGGETAIFLVAGLVLLGMTVLGVRRWRI
jgi:hypothetical protein